MVGVLLIGVGTAEYCTGCAGSSHNQAAGDKKQRVGMGS